MMEDINELAGLSRPTQHCGSLDHFHVFHGRHSAFGWISGKLYVFNPPFRLNYLVLPSSVYWRALWGVLLSSHRQGNVF